LEYHTIDKQYINLQDFIINGRILDIGGGGEGIMAQCLGDGIVVIDKRKDELEEAPEIGIKIVMDACNLQFLDNTFDHITCFYSLMYMSEASVKKCLSEAYRALKSGGCLWIWDAVMSYPATADVFLAPLDICFVNGVHTTPTYGISWHKEQSLESIAQFCEAAGFDVKEKTLINQGVFLKAVKVEL